MCVVHYKYASALHTTRRFTIVIVMKHPFTTTAVCGTIRCWCDGHASYLPKSDFFASDISKHQRRCRVCRGGSRRSTPAKRLLTAAKQTARRRGVPTPLALWEEADVVTLLAKLTGEVDPSGLCIRPTSPEAVVWTPENCVLMPIEEARRFRRQKRPKFVL